MAPLLDLDEDLGRGLAPALYEQVRRWLVVPVWSLRRGQWAAALEPDDMMRPAGPRRRDHAERRPGGSRTRSSWGRATCSVRGSPTDAGPLSVQVEWQVIEPGRVAVLDRRFAGLVCRWPEVVSELLGRVQRRATTRPAHGDRPAPADRAAPARVAVAHRRALVRRHAGGRARARPPHARRARRARARPALVDELRADVAPARGLLTRVHDGWILHGEPPRELHTLSRTTGHGALGD